MSAPPAFEDIAEAAQRIAGEAIRTPVVESAILNDRVGARVLVKAETLQRTGSFKFRGAYNAISRLAAHEWPGGVVTCSSGNHAQGAAEAARLCGLKAAIVMPADAPALKIERTRRSGAEIVLYDRLREDRDAIARALCAERRAAFIPPFDHPHVIAGQGTAGLELAEQARAAGVEALEAVLVPASGGGLTAGVALALRRHFQLCAVYVVEPEGFDDYARSLASGAREKNAQAAGSICDALLIGQPGELTFAVNRTLLAGGLAVSDEEAMAAMAFAFHELKLVAEPGGAVALAALLAGRYRPRGGAVGVILSGGNVDPALFARAIGAGGPLS
jgi:threonine dehydratase